MSTEAFTVVCGTVMEECVCVKAPDHDAAHVCKCGGSWSFDPDGTFRVHAMPQPLSPSEAIAYPDPAALLGIAPDWTGGMTVDEYMDRQRRKDGER